MDAKSKLTKEVELHITALKRNRHVLQRDWSSMDKAAPYNMASNKPYGLANNIRLSMTNYNDPRWVTRNYAEANGYIISDANATGTEICLAYRDSRKKISDVKIVEVFNAEQISNMPLEQRQKGVRQTSLLSKEMTELTEILEIVYKQADISIMESEHVVGGYDPVSDVISVYSSNLYSSREKHYTDLLYLFAKWSGHKSRLNRKAANQQYPMGSAGEAAEIFTVGLFLYACNLRFNLGENILKHKLYANNWITMLSRKPDSLISCINDANRIGEYLGMNRQVGQTRKYNFEVSLDTKDEFKDYCQKNGIRYLYEPKSHIWSAVTSEANFAKVFKNSRWKLLEGKAAQMPSENDIRAEFGEFLSAMGLKVNGLPTMNGRYQRVPVKQSHKAHNKDGSYRGFLDGLPSGFAENHFTSEKATWSSKKVQRQLSPEQIQEIEKTAQQNREKRNLEESRERNKAIQTCNWIYQNANSIETDHDYLKQHMIDAEEHIRINAQNGHIIVPLWSGNKQIHSLQFIDPQSGEKRFAKSTRISGLFSIAGMPEDPKATLETVTENRYIVIAEGYSTARSISMAINGPVFISGGASNLLQACHTLRELVKHSPVLICADDDRSNAINAGIKKAKEAAEAVSGAYIKPKNLPAEGKHSDFNDLHCSQGLIEVGNQICDGLKKIQVSTVKIDVIYARLKRQSAVQHGRFERG